MSSPINPNQQSVNLSSNNPYQKIEQELELVIKDAEHGNINTSDLKKAEAEIQKLLKGEHLPPSVQKNLQQALQDLKGAYNQEGNGGKGTIELSKLFQAEYHIQQAENGS